MISRRILVRSCNTLLLAVLRLVPAQAFPDRPTDVTAGSLDKFVVACGASAGMLWVRLESTILRVGLAVHSAARRRCRATRVVAAPAVGPRLAALPGGYVCASVTGANAERSCQNKWSIYGILRMSAYC